MKLTLDTKLPNQKGFIDYNSSIVTIGSCFSDAIGEKLKSSGFKTEVNSMGIIFNPASILKTLKSALSNKIEESHFLLRDEDYLSFDYHSNVSAKSEIELKKQISERNESLASLLKSCTHLQITFGTAWAYQLKKTGEIVANCHKVDETEFDKLLLDHDKLLTDWMQLINELYKLNPKLKILFTVSPVRHSKDGLRENNVSKGMLHELVYNLESEFTDVNYFPSYEILIDELRDYRYYASDLVHPSELAIDYIWMKFQRSYLSDASIDLVQLYTKLKQAKAHKFMNASANQKVQYQEFILQLEEKIRKLEP